MFSGPYNEAMQVAMGETSLGGCQKKKMFSVHATLIAIPDYTPGLIFAHKKDGCTLIFTSGWMLLLPGSVNRCDQTNNDLNLKNCRNHFFNLIIK